VHILWSIQIGLHCLLIALLFKSVGLPHGHPSPPEPEPEPEQPRHAISLRQKNAGEKWP